MSNYDGSVEKLLAKRRDRVIATLLGSKERDLDPFLPYDVSNKYRKVVLDSINQLHDFMVDILRTVGDDTSVINELVLDRLDQIHALVAQNGD